MLTETSILYVTKLSFKNEGEIKTFSDKQCSISKGNSATESRQEN